MRPDVERESPWKKPLQIPALGLGGRSRMCQLELMAGTGHTRQRREGASCAMFGVLCDACLNCGRCWRRRGLVTGRFSCHCHANISTQPNLGRGCTQTTSVHDVSAAQGTADTSESRRYQRARIHGRDRSQSASPIWTSPRTAGPSAAPSPLLPKTATLMKGPCPESLQQSPRIRRKVFILIGIPLEL
ncbi:hypothetical protein BU26DRAFT_350151 [Trematosphaeria pertusa]|uniref:Uncharacterized protein n=1 Tax=Trematosphaeria pertusa TaxID=390896 RepID=A0A6A6ICF2_9PLEO|nr:uncharacterized protein BU26DRAFT_350151 [Trematosphaeria pertusa]KAF2247582.1 hypothetical protein BU26DRAFT_350151 [Trematosphaeria pertusa]